MCDMAVGLTSKYKVEWMEFCVNGYVTVGALATLDRTSPPKASSSPQVEMPPPPLGISVLAHSLHTYEVMICILLLKIPPLPLPSVLYTS